MIDKQRIQTEIENAINNLMIKCERDGTKDSGGIVYGQGEAPKYELNDGGLTNDVLNQIADDMAERWGLEVSIDDKGKREVGKTKFSLWDDENKTIIRLNKIVKHQDWIDFTNNDKANYNLDDVLRYYNELPSISKEKMGGLFFETTNGASCNRIYHGKYGVENTIQISNMVYGKNGTNKPSEYHLRQVLGHEAGHAAERVLTKKDVNILRKSSIPGSVNSFRRNRLTSESEKNRYDDLVRRELGQNVVSNSKAWSDSRNNNKVKMASDYSASRSAMYMDAEDFAETMSAVAYRNASPSEKKLFRIEYPDGKVHGLDDFIRDHKSTYKLACDYVDGKKIK